MAAKRKFGAEGDQIRNSVWASRCQTGLLKAVAEHGATPAISAIVRGSMVLGLDGDDLERFLQRSGIRKVSSRDLGFAIATGVDGATTVAGALAIARLAGIEVLATGGIGGVHRLAATAAAAAVRDESADLVELSRSRLVVVCAGAKSILDLPATWERLETLGIPVLGYRTDELPGFFTADTGIKITSRVNSVSQVASVARAHWSVGNRQSVLVVQPPPPAHALSREAVEKAIQQGLADADRMDIRGGAVTPFLLEAVNRMTEGSSLEANLALLEENAALAAQIACALHAECVTSDHRTSEV